MGPGFRRERSPPNGVFEENEVVIKDDLPREDVPRGSDTPDGVNAKASLAAALLLGASFHFGFAPYGMWAVTVLSIAGFAWLILHLRKASAILFIASAFFYEVGRYGAGVSWIYESVHGFGGASVPASIAVVGVLVLCLALLSTLAVGVVMRLTVQHEWSHRTQVRSEGPLARELTVVALTLAASWVVAEGLLAHFGFSWLRAGVALIDSPLAGLGFLGESILGAAGVFSAALLAYATRRPVLVTVPILFGIIAAGIGAVQWTSQVGTRAVAIVQANVPLSQKWDSQEVSSVLARYISMSEPVAKDRIVVWPEVAVNLETRDLYAGVARLLETPGTTLVAGSPTRIEPLEGNGADRWYNTASAWGEGSGTYVKRKLVPFGEYVPGGTWLRSWLDWINIPMNDFLEGRRQQPPLLVPPHRAGVAICYDMAYPLTSSHYMKSHFIFALSEDAWFGRSNGPHQHLQITRMRAMETGRAIVRATNRGISAIVLPNGKVDQSLPLFTEGVLTAEVPVMRGSPPAYYLEEEFTLILLPLASLLAVLRLHRRRKREPVAGSLESVRHP